MSWKVFAQRRFFCKGAEAAKTNGNSQSFALVKGAEGGNQPPAQIGPTKSNFNKLWLRPENQQKTRIQMAMDAEFKRFQKITKVAKDIQWQSLERSPRRKDMSPTQDWPSVWPAAAPFNQSVVPVPIRMGFKRHHDKVPPQAAYGNLQLMKIPNFLHLTPAHVYRHCMAIKKFCTTFPPELKEDSASHKYTPIELTYSDYLHQGTNIRDARARRVSARVHLKHFGLRDTHAHNKCRQLVGDRYDSATDTFVVETERCPTRRQNIDFVNYVITALYHESHKIEPWEGTMVEELLALREKDRREAEGEPESAEQERLMRRAAAQNE